MIFEMTMNPSEPDDSNIALSSSEKKFKKVHNIENIAYWMIFWNKQKTERNIPTNYSRVYEIKTLKLILYCASPIIPNNTDT